MKKPKAFALAASALALALALAPAALAQDAPGDPPPPPPPPSGHAGPPPHPGHEAPPRLTDEQRAQRRQLLEEFEQRVRPVKEDLRDQRLIYKALSGSPGATSEEIRKIVADMRRLRDQLHSIREEFKAKYRDSGLPEWSLPCVGGRDASCDSKRPSCDGSNRSSRGHGFHGSPGARGDYQHGSWPGGQHGGWQGVKHGGRQGANHHRR